MPDGLQHWKASHFPYIQGKKLGLVGESGSGKSTMALAMMRMIKPPGRIEGGKVIINDLDLRTLTDDNMLKARLELISYIPQGAMNSAQSCDQDWRSNDGCDQSA